MEREVTNKVIIIKKKRSVSLEVKVKIIRNILLIN